ncbi:MAG: 1,6-anhydro-N-acetylmuramyl-L-alanine amidase AmpD [Burkholderiales bacterium]|nr:1,6-anhydro-N-acetylmuramyl-L-alanine amidase AmpD [Burkholderiales bacterium]
MARQPFAIDAAGWCAGVQRLPSSNFDGRPVDAKIDLLVVHNISLPPGEFGGPYIADLFCNKLDYETHPYFDQLRALRVSAHFLVRRNGDVIQFVSANDRAWHAGVSSFCGRERCNDFSIGIEVEGSDFAVFEDIQYEVLAELTAALRQRYPLHDVAGHEHIAQGRKTDPGPYFDWAAYRAAFAKLDSAQSIEAALRFPIPA